jgi:hypothetical protein
VNDMKINKSFTIGVSYMVLLTLLIMPSCSCPPGDTVAKTETPLPIIQPTIPLLITDTPTVKKTPTITKTLTITKTETPYIIYRLSETPSPLDKKRRYEAYIGDMQMQMIAVAIEEYHKDHGDYPESLKDLVPDYMDKVPHTITGQEIRYRKSDYYYPYNLFFDLAYWDNKNGCAYHGGSGEFECN